MSSIEPKTLIASKHENMAKNSKQFNLAELDYFLYVQLDPPLSSKWYLYRIEEKMKDGSLKKIPFPNTVKRESPTWLKFATDYINKSIGLHSYKLTFVDRETDISISLWFSYSIQNDNPDKPYVYMEREKDKTECDYEVCEK